jgi:hypothetical protein
MAVRARTLCRVGNRDADAAVTAELAVLEHEMFGFSLSAPPVATEEPRPTVN